MSLRDEIRATAQLAWPIAITQIAQIGTGFLDAAMAGHASANDLAAVSVGSSVWVALMVTLTGTLLAINPLVAHRVGAEDFKAIPGLVQQALLQGLLLALLCMGLGWALLPVFGHLGLDAEAARKGAGFLLAVLLGLPPLAAYRVLSGYCSSLNSTKPMMVIALLGLALNALLNWLLIYGHWGLPKLGAVGCGWATAIGMWVSFALLWWWIRRRAEFALTQPFNRWQGLDWATQGQLIRLGVPIGLIFLVEVSAFGLVALLLARLGTVSVAAHQIALNMTGILFMIPVAIGHAMTVRVGQALGAEDAAQAYKIGKSGILMGLIYAACSGSLIWLLAWPITGLYSSDMPVRELAAQLVLIAALFQFFDATQAVISGILRGYKITRGPMVIYVTAFWLCGIPLGYWLAFGGFGLAGRGAQGYWYALVVALMIASGLLLWLFRRQRPVR
jgi:MATE family multidrug resistance protein